MLEQGFSSPRDVTLLAVPRLGGLVQVDDAPGAAVLDAAGRRVIPVDEFLHSMSAGDAAYSTLYSYATALLRWWRFLAAIEVDWDDASRVEVRDFVLWLRFTPKASTTLRTGSASPLGYAPATINHNLAVLRSFYDERAGVGQGPVVNPVPTATGRGGERLHAHHNPMEPFAVRRRAPLRQKTPVRLGRGLSDVEFDKVFAALISDRDRALFAFYVSTGARASELLGLTLNRVDVGRQMIGVFRKGTGALQWLPASGDAFVWWRLYEASVDRSTGTSAAWLTLRRPFRPVAYSAMRRVLQRVNVRIGSSWRLHDLRHTAAHRMVADPSLSISDVQWLLGHRHLTTTAIYLRPDDDEVIARVVAHHQRKQEGPVPTQPALAYRREVLETLLGGAIDE